MEDEAAFGIAGPVSWPQAVVSWSGTIGADISAKTILRYQTSLRIVRPFLEHLNLHMITPAVLRDMVSSRKRHAVSNATIRRDLTAVSSVFAAAVNANLTERNPAKELDRKRLAPERLHKIVLPREESLARMRAAVPARWQDMMDFARNRGLRLEEITSLTRDAIDRKNKLLTVEYGKGNKLRVVPLDADDIRLLDRQPPYLTKPLIFWQGKGEQIINFSSRWGGYRSRVAQRGAQQNDGFIGFRFHDLRHLFAVEYLRYRRGSVYDLQAELGHDSITTTERYLGFLTPEETRVAKQGVAQIGAHAVGSKVKR